MTNRCSLSALLAMTALLMLGCQQQSPAPAPVATPRPGDAADSLQRAVDEHLAKRAQLDKTLWREEVLAQHYGKYFVDLWDQLRQSDDALAVLADLTVPQCTLGTPGTPRQRSLGVEELASGEPTTTLSRSELAAQLSQWQRLGYRLKQSEWHHSRFQVDETGQAESHVEMVLHVTRDGSEQRMIVAGELVVRWQRQESGEPAAVASIDASAVRIWRRAGPPPFRLAATLGATAKSAADFLALYDIDGDGDSEILFDRRLFRNEGSGDFRAEPLWRYRQNRLNAAVLADFTGDGRADLLCADPGASPQLFVADHTGRFADPPAIIDAVPPITLCLAITAGDVNGDGDLDVWLTQYKRPYVDGQMPTPYYDSNDGHPSYLLLGDGRGGFVEATEQAGLARKRFRRTYSSSLVDLDDDDDLDLLVVSDFAGIDAYRNDGAGNFTEVNDVWLEARHNFGMSHTFDDFNNDGRLDFYVTGMASTTARRLAQLGLRHPEFEQHNQMRSAMAHGNRMYLAAAGGFRLPPYGDQLARTGWSWGTTSLDFDNDGDRDLFVGNGHISGESARDYCSQFWRHDIYTGSSQPDEALAKLFLQIHEEFDRKQASWNGFEHNSLLCQDEGEYVNLGFLMGLASEFDTRAVVSNDIDSDGRVDLLVVEQTRGRPAVLHVMRNNLRTSDHWIGVRLVDQPGCSPLGAKIILVTHVGRRVTQVVAGDSFTSQHAAEAHFGLGRLDEVSRLDVRWPNGKSATLSEPAIDRYHLVRAN